MSRARNWTYLLEVGWTIAGLHDQPQEIQDRIEEGVRERADAYRDTAGSYRFPDIVLAAHAVA